MGCHPSDCNLTRDSGKTVRCRQWTDVIRPTDVDDKAMRIAVTIRILSQ